MISTRAISGGDTRRSTVLNALYVSLAAVGGLMLLLEMLGGLLIERTLISEPLIAPLADVLIGLAVFGG